MAEMSRKNVISAAALRLRVTARNNGHFTDGNAWDVLAEVTSGTITRRMVDAVKAEALRELRANGEHHITEIERRS
jgi:plasmid stability protein